MRSLRPYEELSTALGADLKIATDKIGRFRSEMMHAKLMRAVHERRLNVAELARRDLERQLLDAQRALVRRTRMPSPYTAHSSCFAHG